MEVIILCCAAGLLLLGAFRFFMFRLRLKRYTKEKGIITNYDVETRYFSTDGTEIEKSEYNRYSGLSNFKKVKYYSPEITYQANDGLEYSGTWWVEMPMEFLTTSENL